MKDKIIYPDVWDNKEQAWDQSTYRAPFFYMHGELEHDSGYDCFNVSPKLLGNLLNSSITLARVCNNRKACLVFSFFHEGRMKGYACYIEDLNAIEYCVQRVLEEAEQRTLSLYHNTQRKIKLQYPEAINLLKLIV